MVVADVVQAALNAGRPVVALESTVLTHGLPYPDNLAAGREAEQAVRARGAVPATGAVLEGRVRVGLAPAELERLARLGPAAAKLSLRDLGISLARGAGGGTTAADTAFLAWRACIRVFATGGLRGVHRVRAGARGRLGRPPGPARHTGGGGLLRGQVHPRRAGDAGVPGDGLGGRGGLPPGHAARVLRGRHGPAGALAAGQPGAGGGGVPRHAPPGRPRRAGAG